MTDTSSFKGKTGLRRLINATGYSCAGLAAAFRHESAFRQELLLLAILAPTAIWLGRSGVERAMLLGVLFLILIVELLNSALEAIVDLASPQPHPLAKRAKDMASAAVLMSLVTAASVWALILL